MEGNAEVLADLDDPPLAVLGPNSFCGEEALMLEAPRNAYVRAAIGAPEDDSTALVVLVSLQHFQTTRVQLRCASAMLVLRGASF